MVKLISVLRTTKHFCKMFPKQGSTLKREASALIHGYYLAGGFKKYKESTVCTLYRWIETWK